MVKKIKDTGSVIVSWDFSKKDYCIMLVGIKKPNQMVEVVNMIKGSEAVDLYHKLTSNYFNNEGK